MLARKQLASSLRISAQRAYSSGHGHSKLVQQDWHDFPQPNAEKAAAYIKHIQDSRAHAAHTANLWKNISIWVCVPVLIAVGINTYYVESEHAEHRAHAPYVSDEDLVEYEFQNIRRKSFFWGDGSKTAFWNDKVNRLKPTD
jgi:cytochrome c oxidase subunit 6a